MQTATLTNEEQIKVPRSVQDALGVRPGDRLGFEIMGDGTVVVRAERTEKGNLLSLRGSIKPSVQGVTGEEMNDTIRRVGGSSA